MPSFYAPGAALPRPYPVYIDRSQDNAGGLALPHRALPRRQVDRDRANQQLSFATISMDGRGNSCVRGRTVINTALTETAKPYGIGKDGYNSCSAVDGGHRRPS